LDSDVLLPGTTEAKNNSNKNINIAKIKAKHYIECSAKTMVNVKEVFEAAIIAVLLPCSKDKQDHKKPSCRVL
jgi:translation elongation factor EF-4